MAIPIHGSVEAGFEIVRDAFAENFLRHGEVGASCSVLHRGRAVVDLYAGAADFQAGASWRDDTVAVVLSVTKGIAAICALMLAERGAIDLDAPIAHYWPEFGASGKSDIPLAWVLSHRAGLAAVDADLTLDDVLAWEPVVHAIAMQRPQWTPGTRHGYHLRSYGWIIGEVVRRVTGRTLGSFLADEIAAPLSSDFWIGLPAGMERRVARLLTPRPPSVGTQQWLEEAARPGSLLARATTGPCRLFGYDEIWNRPEVHAAELPSSNGIGSARAIARIYGAVIGKVGGVRLLRPESVERARRVHSQGRDAVFGSRTTFGLGFMLPPTLASGAGASCFGHGGAGGSIGLADPEAGFSLGYVTNRLHIEVSEDPRAAHLLKAVYLAVRH